MGILRLFLALSVVIHHIGADRPFWWLHAGVAVILFYMISGFYMALVLNQKYRVPAAFYAGRIIRLYPAYLATLLLIVLWFVHNGSATVFTRATGLPPLEQAVLAFMNLLILGQDAFQVINFQFYIEASHLVNQPNAVAHAIGALASPDFFRDDWLLIGQAWTLSSELLFYALAPYVVRSVSRICALIAISLAIRFGLIFGLGYASADWGYQFFPSTLCFFLLGSLSYHVFRNLRLRMPGSTRMVGIGFLVLFAAYGLFGVAHGQGMLATFSYDSVKLWTVYVLFAASLPFVFAATSAWRWDRWLGELSYPIYLNHGLIIGAMPAVLGLAPTSVTGTIMAMVLSTAAAAVMHVAVERPVAGLLHRMNARTVLRAARAVATTGCVAIGIGVTAASTMEPAKPTLMPHLVQVMDGYNIVQVGNDWYAIPIGVPANLETDNPASIRGLLTADTQQQILQMVTAHRASPSPAALAETPD